MLFPYEDHVDRRGRESSLESAQRSCAGSCYGRVHSSYMLKGSACWISSFPRGTTGPSTKRPTASWSWSLSSSGSPSRFGDGLAAGIAERQVALSTARVLTSQRLDEHPLALVVSNAVAGFQVELRRLLLRARGQLLALDHRRPATWAMAPAHLQRSLAIAAGSRSCPRGGLPSVVFGCRGSGVLGLRLVDALLELFEA